MGDTEPRPLLHSFIRDRMGKSLTQAVPPLELQKCNLDLISSVSSLQHNATANFTISQ